MRACHTNLTKIPAASWDGWQLIHHVHGKSKLNVHASNAINALCLAIVHFVDLESGVVQANVTELGEHCGLNTQSDTGNKSISRTANNINRLISAGLLDGEIVWDKQLGCWLPKFINVTDAFWDVVHPEGKQGYNKAREQQLAYRSKGISDKNEWLSVTQAKERRRLAHIKKAFEIRKSKQQTTSAKRKIKLLEQKETSKVRAEIGKQILNELGPLHGLEPKQFEGMINQRIALYRKIASSDTNTEPPPTH